MDIRWLGHSSFLITDSKGTKILTDPFDESVGYDIYRGNVDIVTISHHHFDHNYTKEIICTNVIDRALEFNLYDIKIKGLPTFHDKIHGAKRGENIVYIFEIDGYRLCHLGDLGHILEDEDLDLIGNIDILFVPVGGNFTLDGEEAAKLCKKINSKIVIPMHYATSNLTFSLDGIEKFLKFMKNGRKISSDTLNIDNPITESNKVIILSV